MSTPKSPPETPQKPAMAVGGGKNTPRARHPDGITRIEAGIGENLSDPTKPRESGGGIQVPSTNPAPPCSESDGMTLEGTDSSDQLHDVHVQNSGRSGSAVEESGRIEDNSAGNHSTIEVSPMDWDDFKMRYREALSIPNDIEENLVEEFEKLSKCFMTWADTSSLCDNDRAWKRLKSREQYVRLSEQKLEVKKRHYTDVVQAFQKALELLRF